MGRIDWNASKTMVAVQTLPMLLQQHKLYKDAARKILLLILFYIYNIIQTINLH